MFDKVAADIGFAPTDPTLDDAAIEWFFLDTFANGQWQRSGGTWFAVDVVTTYGQYGYDKMPAQCRDFMLAHPAIFRPILKQRTGR